MQHLITASPPTILSVASAGFAALLDDVGVEPDRLYHDFARRTPSFNRNAESYLLSDYCSLLHFAASSTDTPNFGLRLGLRNSFQILGPLAHDAAAFPTVRRALEYLCTSFESLQQQSLLRLRLAGGTCNLEYRIRDGRIANRRQDSELTIAVMTTFIRLITGAPPPIEYISLAHPRPANVPDYHRLLDAEILFGADENVISFDARYLTEPTRTGIMDASDHSFRNHSPSLPSPEGRDLLGVVTDEIRSHLSRGDVSITFVARKLGLSESSLYRLLRDTGTSFSYLLRTVREQQSLELLALPHIPISEVSLLLGYSEQSAFTRAFTNWAGVSPKAYRRRLLQSKS